MPHVARHDQVLLVVEVVQLAERHVRSRACHVEVEVAWARTAVRGATQRRMGLQKASLSHALACATKSAHNSSPSVARACLAMRSSSPLQHCCARLRAILDSLTGWAGWVRTQEMSQYPRAEVVP